MRYRVLPYRQGSKGAKALADALGGRVLKLEGSTFVPKPDDVLINWGNTEAAALGAFLNPSAVIKNASNKLKFFNLMKEKGLSDVIPDYWTYPSQIPQEVFEGDGQVVCRTVLAGHSGDGIVIASDSNGLVAAPLYVRYVPKKEEYRVHQGRGGLICVQRKARKLSVPDQEINWQVRNLANGFNFVWLDKEDCPAPVLSAAERALQASGLDFGGCDIIWNVQKQQALVLEINTACGLEQRTAEAYAAYFQNTS